MFLPRKFSLRVLLSSEEAGAAHIHSELPLGVDGGHTGGMGSTSAEPCKLTQRLLSHFPRPALCPLAGC